MVSQYSDKLAQIVRRTDELFLEQIFSFSKKLAE